LKGLSHLSDSGEAKMVDVSSKEPTRRKAVASGRIVLSPEAMQALESGRGPKGEVLSVARVGAISAVKRTWNTIPLCHPLRIGGIDVDFQHLSDGISVTCSVTGYETTGFEMEALCGVTAALLIVYDMTKAISRGSVIRDVRLMEKSGGRSGHYIRGE